MICQMMTHVLQGSRFVAELSKMCSVDLRGLLDYDCIEYSICEHRRLLCKPENRKRKTQLTDCAFTRSHREAIVLVRHSVLKHMKVKHKFCVAAYKQAYSK